MPNLLRPNARLFRPFRLALFPALLAGLLCSGCSSGGSGDGAGTGSVGVLVTDAPSDDFLRILLEVTRVELLGDEGRATLFEDPDGKEFDLLALRDQVRVIGLGRRVPVGDWEKIRLTVQDARAVRVEEDDGLDSTPVECPPDVGDGLFCEEIELEIPTGNKPGGAKLDLNPRGPIPVRAGELVLVRLDVDANKSIHVVERGATLRLGLRPIVFVDVFTEQLPGRLVLLEGTVEVVDPVTSSFLLCGDPPVFDASGGGGEELADHDRCVTVEVGEGTSHFGPTGIPIRMEELAAGDDVAVLGRFRLDVGEDLRFVAEVVQLGGREVVDRVKGVVIVPAVATDGDFAILPDPYGPVEAEELPVFLLEGAKIFSRSGEPLTLNDVLAHAGQRVRVFGWLVEPGGESPSFDAAVVFVKLEDGEAEQTVVRGPITAPFDGETFEMRPEGAEVVPLCVEVGVDDDLFRLVEEEEMIRLVRIAAGDLTISDFVDVFGVQEEGEICFDAETVIAQEPSA